MRIELFRGVDPL